MDSAYFKPMNSEKTALLLQQIKIPCREQRVLFACVCKGDQEGIAGSFCTEAVDFFREHFFEKEFEEKIYEFFCRKKRVSFSAAILKNEEMTAFGTGDAYIFLVSRFLGRTRVRKMDFQKADDLQRVECRLDGGEAGVLLLTGGVGNFFREERIGTVFFGSHKEPAEERLRQLCPQGAEEWAAVAMANFQIEKEKEE